MAPAFGSQQRDSSHTAHFSLNTKLRYQFHPLHGADFEIIGGVGGLRDEIHVRLPNNTTRGIPAWMFDEVLCSAIRIEQDPFVDPAALIDLMRLLEVSQLGVGNQGDESNPQNPDN